MAKRSRLIGEIMVGLSYVSVDQINEARRSQMQGVPKKIGECLRDMGYVSDDQIRQSLDIQRLD
jgi:hypothetical protein